MTERITEMEDGRRSGCRMARPLFRAVLLGEWVRSFRGVPRDTLTSLCRSGMASLAAG